MIKIKYIIVVSVMNKSTGIYHNWFISNDALWNEDKKLIYEKDLILIELFKFKIENPTKIYHSIEEFEENEINI